jgi:N-ethylmaleimide reductase
MTDLFSPARFGAIELANRVVMSSLTRNRAGAGNVPTPLMAEYYRQRASAGLILTEATPICPEGHGYPRTPGIHTPEQIKGWQRVTEAVHGADGRIALQLWHVGRISHPDLQPGGALPVAPSAIRPAGQVFTGQGMKDYVTPRALETGEIPGLVATYAQAARNAMEAGFDGVEVHARQRLPAGPVPAFVHQPPHRCLRRQQGKPCAPAAGGDGRSLQGNR